MSIAAKLGKALASCVVLSHQTAQAAVLGAKAGVLEFTESYKTEIQARKNPAPDAYCVTTADGDCVSKDPRCMHQVPGYTVTEVDFPL